MAHVKKHIDIFATTISEFEYVANEELRKEILNSEFEQIKKAHTSTSNDINLQNKKQYKGFVVKIIDTAKEMCDFYGYEYDKLEITNMWINISQKGDTHMLHNHSNNIFSGVWYPFKNQITPIFFYDPRNVASFWQPRRKKLNVINSNMASFKNKQHLGLMFPSWLYHSVPPSDETRISLSWNIMIRGKYGEPNTLQNAHI